MAHGSIRFRITAVEAVVVAVVLVIAAVALVVLQRDALADTVDQTLTQRANDVEALLEEGGAPQQFEGSTAEGFVQLVGSDGIVIVSTPNLAGEPSLNLASTSGGDTLQTVDGLSVDDDAFRLLSRPYDGDSSTLAQRSMWSPKDQRARRVAGSHDPRRPAHPRRPRLVARRSDPPTRGTDPGHGRLDHIDPPRPARASTRHTGRDRPTRYNDE